MLIEKRNFLSGLNGDVAQRLLGDGELLNLMNARVSVSKYGRTGRIENCLGTTQVSDNVRPPYGTDQTIGSAIDVDRLRIIKFNYNSLGYHWIGCYEILTGTTYAVLYDTQVTGGLNFSKTYRIDRNAKISGDLLYWTDNLNPPRRINIEAAIKMNTPGYVSSVTAYNYPMTQSVITWIRRPYGLPVTCTKITSGTSTFLKEFAGQFASRLIYRDGEYSVMSVPSKMVNYNLSTDTYTAVTVAFPLSETFDQDVQIIELAVRNENSPDYFTIKEWNKANTTDLAAINAHNSGSAALSFDFFNNKTGIAVGKEDSVKPSDSIGLTVKTIEYADNRMFHANYVKGYNTPSSTSLTGAANNIGGDPFIAASLKCNSSYQIAIQFRDNSKRRSAIVTNSNCLINVADRTFSSIPYTNIAWSVSNLLATTEIPDWAYYYDILVTKNLRTRFFINCPTTLQYVIKNQDGTYTYQTNYTSNVYAVAVSLSFLNGVLNRAGYVADTNDKCRLYLDGVSTVYESNIIGQDGNYILVAPNNLGSLNPAPASQFEIFTPYKASEDETYYTTGQSYTITNPTLGSRQYSTTSGTIDGDIQRVGFNLFGTWELMSPSNVNWQKWTQFYGETNAFTQLGQVNKTNFICWSNIRITGAQINGLSTFDAGDEKALPAEIGDINKLQLTKKMSDLGQGDIMLAICPTETASLYLGEVTVQGAAKTAYIAETANVIGSVNVLDGSKGTINPESVINYEGKVFWIDVLNGEVVQYSPAGLEVVSRYKMKRFFKNYCQDYQAASTGNLDNINGFHHLPTAVDPFHKEILFTLPGLIYSNYANTLPSYSSVPSYATSVINRFDIYDQLAKTMAFLFEEEPNKWGSNYEFIAEWYETLGDKLIGFKNGIIHIHNSNTSNWNTFYGTQSPVRICFTGNLNPSLLKDLFNIAIEGTDIPNYTVALTAIPNQQITDLASTDEVWENQQGILYATFLKDRLSPNSSGTADEKLFTGDMLTDFCIFLMCEWQAYTGLSWCQFINIGYQPSKGQKQIVNVINQ